MITQELLKNVIQDLDKVEEHLVELAKKSEFQEKRDQYIMYSQNVVNIRQELNNDYDNLYDYETYTGTLDII